MKLKHLLAVAALGLMGHSALWAAPIQYTGNLSYKTSGTGTIGGFGFFDDDATEVDFWTFTALPGYLLVSISATRLDLDLDPALSLYFGTTTADTSLFRHDASFGGMQLIATADDEVPSPGPFGDPLLRRFTLPFAGTYTIAVGGSESDDLGPYRYSILVVPEPGTLALLLPALLVGWQMQRRRGRSSALPEVRTHK